VRKKRASAVAPSLGDPRGLRALVARHLEWLTVANYSPRTVHVREIYFRIFLRWSDERAIGRPTEVTKPILERYQRWLYHYRKKDGRPLSFLGQHTHLVALRGFFRWLARQNLILYNPASDLVLPRLAKRLPKDVLTAAEAEAVINVPDVETELGVRDRAILETLYSTGIRKAELENLKLFDLDSERGTLAVRAGKGQKDRFVPIGERAIAWIEKYLVEVRPSFVVSPDEGFLFLEQRGGPFHSIHLTNLVRRYVEASGIAKHGACHLFRHTMATLMLEGGADIRFIQEILGHSLLTTTQIYTRVSIRKLKEIHTATHPAARLERRADGASIVAENSSDRDREDARGGADPSEDLLSSLAAEAVEEELEDG
jgi:integrase/recombinase XerD